MKLKIDQLFLVVAILCGTMCMTSCQGLIDAIVGSTDNPSQPTPTPTPTPTTTTIEPTTAELTPEQKAETKAQLIAAQKKSATISIAFSYNGVDYKAMFEKPDGEDYKLTSFTSSQTSTIEETLKLAAFTPYITTLVPDSWTDEQIDKYFDSISDEDEGDDEGGDPDEGNIDDDIDDSEFTDKIIFTDVENPAGTRALTRGTDTSSALDMIVGLRTASNEEPVQVQITTADATATLVGETNYFILKSVSVVTSTPVINNGMKIKAIVEPSKEKVPSKVRLSPKVSWFTTGTSKRVEVIVSPKDAKIKITYWDVRNPNVAKIARDRKNLHSIIVKPQSNGDTNLCVKINGKKKYCKIIVQIRVNAVALNNTSLQLTKDETYQLTATVTPKNNNQAVIWSSSDEKVAKVDEKGMVIAVGTGTATITATSKFDTSKKATCTVTVDKQDNTYRVYTSGTAYTDIAIPDNSVTVTSTTTTWAAGTYVVSKDVTISGDVTLTGDVDLILMDGAELKVNGCISGADKELTIYGQKNSSGKLNVVTEKASSIGLTVKNLTVHGGEVSATGILCGIDISGTMYIYQGKVKAVGGSGHGIGTDGSDERTINLTGGELTAKGGDGALAFGGNITLKFPVGMALYNASSDPYVEVANGNPDGYSNIPPDLPYIVIK